MSEDEFREWMEYYRQEPFGEERADLRSGIAASAIVNMWIGKKGKRTKPTDFMPYLKKRGGARTVSQMRNVLSRMASVLNARKS